MKLSNKKIVEDFLETIWNERKMTEIEKFVSADYVDHSFSSGISPDINGLKTWIENTSKAFDHKSVIETIVEENDHVAVRISFHATHIGKWRNMDATNRNVVVKGFRLFHLKNELIIAHWALIDGEALEAAITDSQHACAIKR
jgi:predicted ester cyclase